MEEWVLAERTLRDYHALLKEMREHYGKTGTVRCPYFKTEVSLTSDGFNHLLNKTNREPRTIPERKLKLRLVKKAIQIISVAGTVQEYRTNFEKVGKPGKDGLSKTKKVEYWAFHDIVGTKTMFLIRTIVRRVGDGPHHFWSVMPVGRINKQKLYREGIESA